MKPTRTVLWSLLVATLALGCKKEEDTGDTDTDTDSGDTDTDSGDTDTDTGTQEFTCPTDDPNEPDDSAAEATALAAGTDILGQICEADTDFFALNVTAGCIVDALLDFDEQETDFDLYLYDSTETLLARSESGSTDEDILFKNNGAATTWYLEAVGYLDAEGGYSIGYSCATTTCTDDDNEPNDALAEATALPTPATNEAGQTCLADMDWYAIPVGGGCTVDVHLDFTQATGDLDLVLVDADENLLDFSVSEDDDEDVSYDNLAPATTVYALVAPYQRAEAPYTIAYTLDCPPPCTDDGQEPDDDETTLNVLTAGAAATNAQICLFDDDWYKFTGHDGCDGEVTVTFANGDGDLNVELYDDQLAAVDGSDSGTGVERVQFNLRAVANTDNADFFVVVTPDGLAQNDYTIALTEDCAICDDDAGDDVPGDDDLANADPLAPATPHEGQICAEDADWYATSTIAADCKVTATLDTADDGGDLDLYLVDNNGDGVESSTSETGDEQIVYRALGTDVLPFFLRIEGNGADEGAYTLDYTVDCTPCTDAGEPNEAGPGEPLAVATPFDGVVCDSDEDWYEITAAANCEGFVTVSFDGDAADLDVFLYSDSAGTTEIDSSEGVTGTERVFYDNNSSGELKFYAQVLSFGGFEPPYTIEVETPDCTVCVDDPANDTSGGAAALAAATPTEGMICTEDEDWYALTVTNNCAADVRLDFENASGDLDMYLYKASDLVNEEDFSFSGDDDERIFYPNHTGNSSLLLQVLGYTAPGQAEPTDNAYTVSYAEACTCPEDAQGGTNNSMGTAYDLDLYPMVEGTICADGALASDWYSITLPPGCLVEALIEWGYVHADDSDLDFFLYDHEGTELDRSEFSPGYEFVASPDPFDAEEQVFLKVLGYALDDGLGSVYELQWATDCSP